MFNFYFSLNCVFLKCFIVTSYNDFESVFKLNLYSKLVEMFYFKLNYIQKRIKYLNVFIFNKLFKMFIFKNVFI